MTVCAFLSLFYASAENGASMCKGTGECMKRQALTLPGQLATIWRYCATQNLVHCGMLRMGLLSGAQR